MRNPSSLLAMILFEFGQYQPLNWLRKRYVRGGTDLSASALADRPPGYAQEKSTRWR
jgi:hypothetical protein